MISLYYETAHEIGYSNPPPAILATLKKDQLAYARRTYKGAGLSERTCGWEILIDEEQMLSAAAPISPEYIFAHELAHVECSKVLGGGGETADGEKHGASFLACWLQMLRRMSIDDSNAAELALWHAKRYQLTKKQLKVAIRAAYLHDTPYDSANDAIVIPPTPLHQIIILTALAAGFLSYLAWAIFLH